MGNLGWTSSFTSSDSSRGDPSSYAELQPDEAISLNYSYGFSGNSPSSTGQTHAVIEVTKSKLKKA